MESFCPLLFVVLFLSVGISPSSPVYYYSDSSSYPAAPSNQCGGYCKGGLAPCLSYKIIDQDKRAPCVWAHENCCPPAGDGSQWTTSTTISPNTCGGYCISGKTNPAWDCWDFETNPEESQRCKWALQHCCPPNGDGSQWTTTTATTTEKNEDSGKLATWVIVVIAVGAVLLVAILVGVGICFCLYFNGQKRKRRVNPGGDATPAYGYPGTGAQPGLYQPVIQPQAQFTNDSPFYA